MQTLNESAVRRRALRRDYIVRKSRQRIHVPNVDNHGDYMLIDIYKNWVVLGERFNATLENIDAFLRECDEAKS